jgi:hypothetical protein
MAPSKISQLENYKESGHLDPSMWQAGRLGLTLSGRLIADRIVQEIIL